MNDPRTMLSLAEAYLAERRRLGFALTRSGTLTLSFARFADAAGHDGPLTSNIVLRWAKDAAHRAAPFTWGQRVNVLRPFARYLANLEPATAFPVGAPFGRSRRRLAPHIYTPREIEALVDAARRMPAQGGLVPASYATLFGLLAATGLRISEALRLRCGDVDAGQEHLTVRHSKFQRTRLVPLHPTVRAALRDYLSTRAKYRPLSAAEPLFLSEKTGWRLGYRSVRCVFLKLSAEVGLLPRGAHKAVRIHDLRHTFICRRVMLWHESGADIDNAMMALSTYVGHANLTDTYWYLHAVPDLMAVAGSRFETFAAQRGEVRHG